MLYIADSLLESMACAVEQAAVVLICFSEKYKDSPNCRTGDQNIHFMQQAPLSGFTILKNTIVVSRVQNALYFRRKVRAL